MQANKTGQERLLIPKTPIGAILLTAEHGSLTDITLGSVLQPTISAPLYRKTQAKTGSPADCTEQTASCAGGEKSSCLRQESPEKEPPVLLQRAADQILSYLAGERRQLDLPYSLKGTPFQQAVRLALLQIPYGQTLSYGMLADLAGYRGAARAVGQAMHTNPLPLLLPCHRVIRSDGSLCGYGGGEEIKRFLLALEQAHK